jgi:hypothetical protein
MTVMVACTPNGTGTGTTTSSSTTTSTTTTTVPTDPPVIYKYAGMGQTDLTATGASAQFNSFNPTLVDGSHTLGEVAVQTVDPSTGKNVSVEAGLGVDYSLNNDYALHFWTYVNQGAYQGDSNYNDLADNFRQVSSTIVPGMAVTPNQPTTIEIRHAHSEWEVFYNGTLVGGYADSIWGGRFATASVVEVFDEDASWNPQPCDSEGNGIFGDQAGAASFSNITFDGTSVAINPFTFWTNDTMYRVSAYAARRIAAGGPGATCSAPAATPAARAPGSSQGPVHPGHP